LNEQNDVRNIAEREREENKKTERRTERKEQAGIERWKEKKDNKR